MRAATLLLALVACGRAEAPRAGPVAFGPARPAEIAPLRHAPLVSHVVLLDPGRAPRRLLRYHPVAGTRQRISVTHRSRAVPLTFASSDVHTRTDLRVERVEDGTIHIAETPLESDVGLPGIGGSSAEEARLLAAFLRGHPTVAVIDDRGLPRDVKTSITHAHVTPLPAEPVGVGARWQAHLVRHQQAIVSDAFLLYELAALDGDRLSLRVRLVATAPAQRLRGPTDLVRMSISGRGELTLDLGRPLALEATTSADVVFTVLAPGGGELPFNVRSELVARQE